LGFEPPISSLQLAKKFVSCVLNVLSAHAEAVEELQMFPRAVVMSEEDVLGVMEPAAAEMEEMQD
jgi:hypothetical protein